MVVPKFYLDSAIASSPDPEIHKGGSGYFSHPETSLDTHLFDDHKLKPEVRSFILDNLYEFWGRRYHDPRKWSTVWLAGSGASYQWAADRSNGDLDILIGVDFNSFDRHNPTFSEIPEPAMADIFNKEFHGELWPSTANTNFNGQNYEVTFYVNPGAQDIRDINPYAAYNITKDSWTVEPLSLPEDPHKLYPTEFYKAAEREAKHAKSLVARYHTFKSQAAAMPAGSPGRLNADSAAQIVVSQAKALFDSIHLGRKAAFAKTGAGYGDFYNFRWQYHKQGGTAEALHSIAEVQTAAQEAEQRATYGQPLKSATAALTEAMLGGRFKL